MEIYKITKVEKAKHVAWKKFAYDTMIAKYDVIEIGMLEKGLVIYRRIGKLGKSWEQSFPKVWENAAKPNIWKTLGIYIPMLFPNLGS